MNQWHTPWVWCTCNEWTNDTQWVWCTCKSMNQWHTPWVWCTCNEWTNDTHHECDAPVNLWTNDIHHSLDPICHARMFQSVKKLMKTYEVEQSLYSMLSRIKQYAQQWNLNCRNLSNFQWLKQTLKLSTKCLQTRSGSLGHDQRSRTLKTRILKDNVLYILIWYSVFAAPPPPRQFRAFS